MSNTGDSSAPPAMRRAACDKCHDSKTRCLKDVNSDGCQRCTRLGLACTYRPPLRMGRPKENAGQKSTGKNAVPPVGGNQDVAIRGREKGSRGLRNTQTQKAQLRAKVAQNEQGASVPIPWDQGPTIVAANAGIQHGLGKDFDTNFSPNSSDSGFWHSQTNRSTTSRSTASLSTPLECSDTAEGIWIEHCISPPFSNVPI